MSIGPWDFGGFDIVVLLLLVISGLMSLSRGFLREIVSIAALVAGLLAALFLFGRFQNAVQDMIQPLWLANGTLGLGSFALAYMLVTFILRGGVKKLRGREPGFIDRLFGLGFGIFRGLLISALFVILWTMASRDNTTPGWIEQTTFYPILKPITQVMMNVPFARIKDSAEDTVERGREADPEQQDEDNVP
ncbi:CvpA family protein [Robiginitomaculum antarcticum]|uniref:CvpA family protein n=1 Tax=Robiginitomaculum antarcticum TaxID=437507 RepID=UPI00037CF7B2|nr:CvpA family protein [Robiginitomaculum antarcticum]